MLNAHFLGVCAHKNENIWQLAGKKAANIGIHHLQTRIRLNSHVSYMSRTVYVYRNNQV